MRQISRIDPKHKNHLAISQPNQDALNARQAIIDKWNFPTNDHQASSAAFPITRDELLVIIINAVQNGDTLIDYVDWDSPRGMIFDGRGIANAPRRKRKVCVS